MGSTPGISYLTSDEKHDVDVEVENKEQPEVTADGIVVDQGLYRSLKQRHLQMIALGGVIG